MKVHFITSVNCLLVSVTFVCWTSKAGLIACENIRFSSLFAARDVSRNVPSGEERGETDVFAGYRFDGTPGGFYGDCAPGLSETPRPTPL